MLYVSPFTFSGAGTLVRLGEKIFKATDKKDIDRAARGVLTAAGFGEAFFHRTGHGLGLSLHEEPYLVEGNTLPLAAGMVFSDEPGVYFPDRFGIRIEDTVLCTETGGRRLNEATRALTVMS